MGSLMMQIGAAVPSSPMELVTQSSGETKVVLVILADPLDSRAGR